METNRIEERIYLNNEDEREIDLLDCIFSVLDKWRVLVLIGIAAFIVLGAFTFIKTEMGRKENEALIAEGREDEVINPSAYQSALDALDAKEREIRELETAIVKERTNITGNSQNIKDAHNGISSSRESIKIFTERQDVASTKLNEITDYLDNSVLMQINAVSKPQSRRVFQVLYDGSESIDDLFRDPVDEIVGAYSSELILNETNSKLAGEIGIDQKYVNELYSISSNLNANTVTVTATGVDKEMSEKVLSEVCSQIKKKESEISERYHAHGMKEVYSDYMETVDKSLQDTQSSRRVEKTNLAADIQSYTDQIDKANTAIENYELAILDYETRTANSEKIISENETDIKKIKKEILEDDLEAKVAAKAPSLFRSVKDAIKFGIIAGIVGAVVMAGIYLLQYVMGGKVHTAGDVTDIYGLPLLAVFNRTDRKKQNFIDKWLRKIFGRTGGAADDEILRTAAVSIRKCTGDLKEIALLGTCNDEAVKSMAEKLGKLVQVSFVPVTDSVNNAQSAASLASAEGVIILETREQSKLNAIDAEIRQAVLLEKPVLGCIIM